MIFVAVAGAGALGALTRYMLTGAVQRWTGSLVGGTLTVNVIGCFVVGLLGSIFLSRMHLSPALRASLVSGFLGAFTTFSAFGYETLDLLRRAEFVKAITYVAASLLLGLAAVWLGFELGSRN